MIGRKFRFIEKEYYIYDRIFEVISEIGYNNRYSVLDITKDAGTFNFYYKEGESDVLNLADKRYWEEVNSGFWDV